MNDTIHIPNSDQDLSKIAYFVPNVPRYEIRDREEFWNWWQEVNIPIKRLRMDSRGNGGGYDGDFWDGVTIWQSQDYQDNIVWKVNYSPNDSIFGGLIDRIRSEIPWYDIKGITLWSNKDKVGLHQDGLPRDPFPSAPRIVLLDECTNKTFYLVHKDPFKIFYPDLKVGSNLFYFNNENFYHGTSAPIGGRKILIRIDGRLVDKAGLIGHIKSSIQHGSIFEKIDD